MARIQLLIGLVVPNPFGLVDVKNFNKLPNRLQYSGKLNRE